MSTLVSVSRKAEAIQGYQLLTQDDMFAALKYIVAGGYSGNVTVDATGTWALFFQSTSANNQMAVGHVNDWVIIENNSIASICPASKFGNLYTSP